jgi:tetratricopeptide (TPR) repeat protein
MTLPRLSSAAAVVLGLALLAGAALLAYAGWTKPLVEAAEAAHAGDADRALAAYAAAEARFDQWPVAKTLLKADYRRTMGDQLALLYRAGDYDRAIEKAALAPPDAGANFWAGCALFAKAGDEPAAEARLALLSRAEEEFRDALRLAPDDWDTKYNYELTSRLAAELRKQPKTPPKTLMQLLRPQPKEAQQAIKKSG